MSIPVNDGMGEKPSDVSLNRFTVIVNHKLSIWQILIDSKLKWQGALEDSETIVPDGLSYNEHQLIYSLVGYSFGNN